VEKINGGVDAVLMSRRGDGIGRRPLVHASILAAQCVCFVYRSKHIRRKFMPSMLTHPLETLRRLNETSAFNRWCDMEIEVADAGRAEISIRWRPELAQYSGFAHAGVVGALIDTACGCAAATMVGTDLLASHYSVNFLRPAIGERFRAVARVVKPGRSQIFTACEIYATAHGKESLVATGETILVVVSDDQSIPGAVRTAALGCSMLNSES
jgi:uncharacterized protein (TIGR00369 family)